MHKGVGDDRLTKRRHYRNAPIIEATISIGVVPPAGLNTAVLAKVRDLVKDQYPEVVEEHLYSGKVSAPEAGRPPEHDDSYGHTGFSFFSEDNQRKLSVMLDSFDFSIRGSYDRWESFRDEACQLWKVYKDVTGVERAVRLAVRYVNRIDIPGKKLASGDSGVDVHDYVKIRPEVPDEWPGGHLLHNFFMQLQMWQADLECMLVINQAPDIPPREGNVSIRLDFDLFKEIYEDPWSTSDDSEIWKFMEMLHERKNLVFEASITDDTREIIQ